MSWLDHLHRFIYRPAGVDVNHVDNNGKTKLLMAINDDDRTIVNMLQLADVDLTKKGKDGLTPLQYAELLSRTNIVEMLTSEWD